MTKKIEDMSEDERNAFFDRFKEVNIVVRLSPVFAEVARRDINDPSLKPLLDIIAVHGAGIRERNQLWVEYYEGLLASSYNPQAEENLREWYMDAVVHYPEESFEALREGDRVMYKEKIEGFKKDQGLQNIFEIVKDGTGHFIKGSVGNGDLKTLVSDLKGLEGKGIIEKAEVDEKPSERPQWEIWARNHRAHW